MSVVEWGRTGLTSLIDYIFGVCEQWHHKSHVKEVSGPDINHGRVPREVAGAVVHGATIRLNSPERVSRLTVKGAILRSPSSRIGGATTHATQPCLDDW